MSRPGFSNYGRSIPQRPSAGWAVWMLVGLVAAPFIVGWLGGELFLSNALGLVPGLVLGRPWTILTFPLAASGGSFFGVLFGGLWLYMMGTALEEEIGSSLLSLIFLALVLISGLSLSLTAFVGGANAMFSGMWIPGAALTALWAARRPEQTVMLMFVIPIKAKWLGWITAGLVLFGVGWGAPMVGVLSVVPLGAAALYGLNRIPGLRYGVSFADFKAKKKQEKQFNSYMDDVKKREKDRAEKEKLRRLFEASLIDDPEDGGSQGKKGR